MEFESSGRKLSGTDLVGGPEETGLSSIDRE